MADAGLFQARSGTHYRQILDPWVLRSLPVTDPAWQRIEEDSLAGIRAKLRKRSLFSAFGLTATTKSHRTVKKVEAAYETIWRNYNWPRPGAPTKKRTYARWEETGLTLWPGCLGLMHLDLLMDIVDRLRPKSVVEIGSGPGSNLFALAAVFPDIAFTGIELSRSGFETSKSVQSQAILPTDIAAFNTRAIIDDTAHQRIDFRQANATQLPFSDNEFDLVFSRQAIEQMELIRDQVLPEMVRITRRYVVMFEPFADFNKSEHKRLATKKKNHFSASVADLPAYGLTPVAQYAGWPQKIDQGIGMVAAETSNET